MKRILLTILATASILTACDRSNTEIADVPSTGNVLVLNNGKWGGNDASITLYDSKTGAITANAFQKANGQNLGDLGQHILAAGNELYIARMVHRLSLSQITTLRSRRQSQLKRTVTGCLHDISPKETVRFMLPITKDILRKSIHQRTIQSRL